MRSETPQHSGSGDPRNPHADARGHPLARGTLPMARYLTDLAIEDQIQARG